LFKISGARALGVTNFDRYTLEDSVVKASEMLQDGMDHLTLTTPDGRVLDEAKLVCSVDCTKSRRRELSRRERWHSPSSTS
jgi:hypothetical protein